MLHGNEIQNTLCIFVHSSLVLEINLQCCDLFQSICSYAKLQEGCTHIEIWLSTEPSAPSITHGWSQPVLVLWTFGSLFFILPHHNHLHTSRWYLKFSVCVWQDNIWGSTRKRAILIQKAWVLMSWPAQCQLFWWAHCHHKFCRTPEHKANPARMPERGPLL